MKRVCILLIVAGIVLVCDASIFSNNGGASAAITLSKTGTGTDTTSKAKAKKKKKLSKHQTLKF